MSELVKNVKTYIEPFLGVDQGHDIDHCLRVMKNALFLAHYVEPCDLEVLELAALLHDMKNYPKDHPLSFQSSQESAHAAKVLFTDPQSPFYMALDASRIEILEDAIRSHSFSANIEPTTIEGKIFQDADRLDALGAVGIARVFAISKGKIFDIFDPMAQERPLDDKAFALDHFQKKLFLLPERMQTLQGRIEATKRVNFMKKFVYEIQNE
jgi:uncharacterized protein